MEMMPEGPVRPMLPWGTRERTLQWVRMWINAVLLGFILVGANLLARGQYVRMDWTWEKSYELDDTTIRTLRSLDRDVTIYLVPPGQELADDKSLATVWVRIRDLCQEFQKRSSRVRISFITEADLPVLEELKRHFEAPVGNSIYFVGRLGPEKFGRKAITVAPGIFYDGNPNTGKLDHFSGERWMLAGLKAVSTERTRVIYSAVDHKEATVSTDPRGLTLNWVAKFLAEREGVELRPLRLREADRIPNDCDALLLAGPQVRLEPRELETIESYLSQGGRLFLAYFPKSDPGLADLLEKFGLRIGPGWVCDNSENLGDRSFLRIQRFGAHEINRGMQPMSSVFTVFFSAIVASTEVRPPECQVGELFRSGPGAWEELGPLTQQRPEVSEGEERGELWLGASVLQAKTGARLIVWGSAHALTDANVVLQGRVNFDNLEYILNHFRWLLGREERISIPPKKPGQRPMDLSPSALDRIKWVTLGGFPGLGILVGILAWFLRRK